MARRVASRTKGLIGRTAMRVTGLRDGAIRRATALALDASGPTASQLLIIPQDLRTADPALAVELAAGTFGLAGRTVALDGRSPFSVSPPSESWSTALHGFDWLRDLRADGDDFARATARGFVRDWIQQHGDGSGPAWRPAVAGRRVISWLTNAHLLLEGVDQESYDTIIASLNRHVRRLARARTEGSDGAPVLMAQIAAMLAGLCLAGYESLLDASTAEFCRELDRQILPDGGHISRNPAVIVELLLDLLPLRHCFVARNRTPPEALATAIARMIRMLRYMRLGDGTLAHFNGVGVTPHDKLGAVLAFDEEPTAQLGAATRSRYARMQRRSAVLILDAGAPPPPELSGDAHAGCLAFEMSAGLHPLIVNAGAPGPAHQDWRQMARSTASHSTLALDEHSSGQLLRNSGLEKRLGAPGLAEPSQVELRMETRPDGELELRGQHNGYTGRYGMQHARLLRLSAQGSRLEGQDRLFRQSKAPGLAGRASLPFAIHFHCHPTTRVTKGDELQTADLTLPSGETWRLTALGADLGLEESVFLATDTGPVHGIQVVLRGQALEDTEVRWRLERMRQLGKPAVGQKQETTS